MSPRTTFFNEDHVGWMKVALIQARGAANLGMRPFGCVIVKDGRIVGLGSGSETPTDPTRHSECVAIRDACLRLGGPLHGCFLYSTHEPCGMCCGAINHAKLALVAWGSARRDLPTLFRRQRFGAYDRLGDTTHPPHLIGGLMREECVALFDGEVDAAVSGAMRALADHAEGRTSLSPSEIAEYERCQRSVVEARRAGERLAPTLWVN